MREVESQKDKEIDFYRGQLQEAMVRMAGLKHTNHELDRQLSEIKKALDPSVSSKNWDTINFKINVPIIVFYNPLIY